MFTILKLLFKPITGIIKNWQNNKLAIKTKKLDMKLAEMENKSRLLRDDQSNNAAWEMANLQDKDKLLRRVSFTILSAPFILAFYDVDMVSQYFDVALKAMPDWYVTMYFSVVGGIWGISAMKNALPAVLSGVKRAWKD